MRDEVGFVLLCCRVFVKTAGVEELGVYVREHELDWEVVYEVSGRHRVRPLVYRVLSGGRMGVREGLMGWGVGVRDDMRGMNEGDIVQGRERDDMQGMNRGDIPQVREGMMEGDIAEGRVRDDIRGMNEGGIVQVRERNEGEIAEGREKDDMRGMNRGDIPQVREGMMEGDIAEGRVRDDIRGMNRGDIVQVRERNEGDIAEGREKDERCRLKWEKMQEGMERLSRFARLFSVFAFNRQVEMVRIEGVLRQRGIKVKLYKGMDFAKVVYGDIAMREFTDMDVMIDVEDVPALIEIMISEGYSCSRMEYFRKFPHRYVEMVKDICFEKPCPPGGIYAFEFHYRPVKYFMYESYSFEALLGKDYLSSPISREDYYRLMLLNHGSSDFFPDLKAIVDMVLLDGGGVGLPEELRRFEKLWQAVAVQLLHYKVLPDRLVEDRALMRTVEVIIKRLVKEDTGKIGYVRRVRLQMGFDQSFGRKVRTIVRGVAYLLIPNGEDIKEGGSSVYSVYYFTKLVRLVKKHIKSV
jgi:hypothetical protein